MSEKIIVTNEVRKTSDYSLFQFEDKNRSVNPGHLNKLKASIKKSNLLSAQPITVNEDYEIIDGQHRFMAALELEVPVFFVMEEGLTIDDAITLNINTKNWTYKDYLRYWIKQGNEHYVYFKQFMRKYGFGYSVSLALLGLERASDGNRLTDIFNAGKFIPKYKVYAEDMGDKCLEMKEYGAFATNRTFVLAFDEAKKMDGYDHETFMKKLEMAPDRFRKCSSQENYLRMMEDVINYHNHGERIRLY